MEIYAVCPPWEEALRNGACYICHMLNSFLSWQKYFLQPWSFYLNPIDTFQLAIWLIVSSLRPPQKMRCIPYMCAVLWAPKHVSQVHRNCRFSNLCTTPTRDLFCDQASKIAKQVCQAHPNFQLSAATPPFPLAHSSTNLTVLCTSAPPRGLRNWSDRSCNFIGDVTLQAFGNKGFVGSCRTNETRWFSSMLHFTCRCSTKGISVRTLSRWFLKKLKP